VRLAEVDPDTLALVHKRALLVGQALVEKLLAENAHLSELLNKQSTLLDKLREAAESGELGSPVPCDVAPSPQKKSASLISVVWDHVAGYADSPHGRVL
jgi:hypothetical protein